MPVVGIIAGPLGSPLVNMGGGDGEGARIYSKIYKAIINISHRQVIIILIPTLISPASAASLTL